MVLIDCDFWEVRRKIRGVVGASQVMSAAPAPVTEKRVPYLRRRQKTCNPTSTLQTEQRARWQIITHAWADVLTANERYWWNYYADGYWRNWYDEEQQHRHLNGFQWFCGLNGRRMRVGRPLLTGPWTVAEGEPLDTFDFTFLSSTSIRVTFSPAQWFDHGPILYARGPDSPGTTHVVPPPTWWRDSAPSRWYYLGYGDPALPSPIDFTIPHAVPLGRKLAIIACLMEPCGALSTWWLLEQHVRT